MKSPIWLNIMRLPGKLFETLTNMYERAHVFVQHIHLRFSPKSFYVHTAQHSKLVIKWKKTLIKRIVANVTSHENNHMQLIWEFSNQPSTISKLTSEVLVIFSNNTTKNWKNDRKQRRQIKLFFIAVSRKFNFVWIWSCWGFVSVLFLFTFLLPYFCICCRLYSVRF